MPPLASLLVVAAPLWFQAPESPQETHLGAYAVGITGLPRPVAVAFGAPEGDASTLHVAVQGSGTEPPGIVVVEVPGRAASESGAAPRRVRTLGAGVLERPTGLAVDDRGDVYVTDELQHTLWRFPAGGGEPVALAGRDVLALPADVDVRTDGDVRRVVIADAGSGTVRIGDLGAGTWQTLGAAELVRPIAACFLNGEDGAPRIAVCDGARHEIDIYELDGTHVANFADWGAFPSLLSTPSGIASASGRLFVADTENHRVQAFESRAIRGKVGRLAYRFGVHAIQPGEGEGALHYPSGLDIDEGAQWLALAEPLDDRVQIFGRAPGAEPVEDQLRAAIGPPTAHLGPSVSAAGQYIATISPESHRVQIHDVRFEEPVEISETFGFGERLGMLRGPVDTHLFVDRARPTSLSHPLTLLTVDAGNGRLSRSALRVRPRETLQQDPELAMHLDAVDLGQLVGRPVVPGAVTRIPPQLPQEPGTADGGTIAVADRVSDSVLLLSPELELEARLQGDDATGPMRGIAGLASTTSSTLLVVDGAGAGRAPSPGGRVLEFDRKGELLRTFGEGLLLAPDGIATHDGRIWVTDRARDRVEVFVRREDGSVEHERGFGERGLGRAQFHGPRGVAVLGDGRLIVIDHGNHRGQIFDADGNFLKGFGSRLYIKPLK